MPTRVMDGTISTTLTELERSTSRKHNMRELRSFLGETTDFDQGFPELTDAVITFEESDFGNNPQQGRWSLRRNGPRMRCGNGMCKRGGYDFESQVRLMIYSRLTEREIYLSCPGDEGSPKGLRKGRECMQRLKGKITLTYKGSDVTDGTK